MPELPEVETVRRQLVQRVVGKVIADVDVLHPKTVRYNQRFAAQLQGRRVAAVDRVGKLLIFSFAETPEQFLLVHLKMTGQFFYRAGEDVSFSGGHSLDATFGDGSRWPHKHTRVVFSFADGAKLYFNDMRLFGYMRLVNQRMLREVCAAFGTEPLAENFDPDQFSTRLRARRTSVKAVLLDQRFVAGLGNIYVDEVLWRTRVRPWKRAHRVTRSQAQAIAAAAREILQEAIAQGGTTFQSFRATNGTYGNFKDSLAVFGRTGEACARCGTPIRKRVVAGRGTHYCPHCQR